MIFSTHRELFKLRPAWQDLKAPACPGKLVVRSETEHEEIWEASCDVCGLEIGIPPRQQREWLAAQGVTS